MKRMVVAGFAILALTLGAGGDGSSPAGLFEMPFKFVAGGQNFAPGEYRVEPKSEGQIVLRQESTGREFSIPFIERLPRAERPVEEPRLVFSMVGNFEPSYTEYVTDYVLTEVWLDEKTGFLIRAFRGTYQTQVVNGRRADD